ncbi:hypothetical protein SAY86_010684 [Trapa natans]|uniref:Uncharacterized protein n=1 Tax=Trapa natans TaxID=22666 RepID=A0AAN7LII9_TRANT|nr:hypothetical protein SAY86_010684 [Trapa natans]
MALILSSRAVLGTIAVLVLACATFCPASVADVAESTAPALAPGPASDGTSIDQGIAYVLMAVALVLTYLIHPLDAASGFLFS